MDCCSSACQALPATGCSGAGRNTVAEQVVPPQERSKVVAQVVQLQVHNTAAAAVLVVAAAHYIALQAAHIVTAVGNLPVQEQ